MDEKQEACFTETIQWVIDEAKWRQDEENERSALEHDQNTWGEGSIGETEFTGTVLRGTSDEATYGVRAVCGSACCVAGAAVLHAGDQFVIREDKAQEVLANRQRRIEAGVEFAKPPTVAVSWCVDAEGNLHGIPERAADLMGLSWEESHELFNGDNTVNDIMRIAGDIARRHRINPEFIW